MSIPEVPPDRADLVKSYYSDPGVVAHYAEATRQVGLWKSEEKVFRRVFRPEDSILELGTGTGRIALGLWELGYRRVIGVDVSKPMIEEARKIARVLGYGVPLKTGDPVKGLEFEENLFEGVIFGFNGLMQIPGKANRQKAMAEIYRVLRPGRFFVFTTHDRESGKHAKFWQDERKRWDRGEQKAELLDFGDRFEPTPLGDLFIHVPTRAEVSAALKEIGFKVEADAARSVLASESPEVREFSDECRFWVARKP